MTVVQSSWADEIEEGDSTTLPAGTLPMPSESIQGNKKITTEYSINDDGKKTKIVRTFEIIKKQVPKAVAQRKALPKFGMSRNDRPGPDPATTIIAEEVGFFDSNYNILTNLESMKFFDENEWYLHSIVNFSFSAMDTKLKQSSN